MTRSWSLGQLVFQLREAARQPVIIDGVATLTNGLSDLVYAPLVETVLSLQRFLNPLQ